jgi:hypothetical protein
MTEPILKNIPWMEQSSERMQDLMAELPGNLTESALQGICSVTFPFR